MSPGVSICLLTYNRGHLLRGTLDSLLRQTYPNFELIINDDRSTDETSTICKELASRDSRVKYFRNSENLRYANNQNAAIARASHDLVAIVHDGEIYDPGMIAGWAEALVQNPEAAFVFNAYAYRNSGRREILPIQSVCDGMQLLNLTYTIGHSLVWGIAMVRKACVLRVGPFDERLPTLADVDMWHRLMISYRVAYVPKVYFEIEGREPNHENTVFNWRITAQTDFIYWINAKRAYSSNPPIYTAMLRHVEFLIWRRNLANLVWCIRCARVGAVLRGIRHLATHPARRKAVLTGSIAPIGRTEFPERSHA